MKKTNAGYTIIESTAINAREEIVIGLNEDFGEYVCWWHRTDNDDYFWGNYSTNYNEVKESYNERIQNNMSRF